MLDQNYIFRDGSVTYLNFIHEFRKRRLPIIQCGIEMETRLIKLLYEYKDTATIKLDVYEQQLSSINGDILGTTLFMQHTFSIVPMRDINVYITATDQETEKLTDVMKTLQNFEMYLVDMDVVNWFNQQISATYEKVTHAEALNAVFLEREIPPSIIVATPPLIVEEIEKVAIPLQDLVHNIYHLNHTYGLYDCIPFVYHDLTYLYCLSKRNPDIVMEDTTEYGNVAFILLDPSDPAHEVTGSCDDAENKTHWINLNQPPAIYDESVRDTSAKFSTITTVNAKGEVTKTTLDESATALTYIYAITDLTESQMLNEFISGHIIALEALNSSVRFIKPYKDYTFATGESYMNLGLAGNIYRLLGWVLGIHREGTNNYLSEVTMTLYNPERKASEEEASPSTIDD
ncbi:MAG: hypothetical protein NC489_16555 [Ruminococcus flavefaciens]|nr:hypothetical protein [Ruminococcus flavefaciens]